MSRVGLRRWGIAPALLCAPLAAPAAADAHGLSGRTDLPIPDWLFAWGVAVVLVLSFVALAVFWPEPQLERPHERTLLRLPRGLDPVCGVIGVAIFAFVVWCGLTGTQEEADNLAPTFVYVIFWVGVAVASAVLGDVFRPFNPWLAVGRAAGSLRRRRGPERPYPARLGFWPAVVGLAAFAWLELVAPNRADPSLLAVLALGYAAVQCAGMAWWGAEPWSRRGDAFGVYFALLARLAPLAVRERKLFARPPLAGTTTLPAEAGVIALVCVALGATAFDGLSNSSVWSSVVPTLTDAGERLGFGPNGAVELAGTIGLLGGFALVALIYETGVRGMADTTRAEPRVLRVRFVHSLIPIAFAYVFAHYFSLLVFQGQAAFALVSDPLGTGADVFGTAQRGVDYNVVSSAGIWYVQVAALTAGHVGGLILAHDRALVQFRDSAVAVRSQYWMLAVMVGFTSLGLWLLSAVAT